MKTFILLALAFSSLAFGKATFTLKDFSMMSVEQKARVIDAYKDFLREYSKKTDHGEFASVRFSFFTEAYASGSFDCFYAGWPSQTVRSGSKRLCTSPLRGNPDYARLASSCGANSLLCQPSLFGDGLCVSTATKKLRNSAFSQCEYKFRSSGRTTADVIRELTPEKRADLDELIVAGQNICAHGLQAGTGMCKNLVSKLLAIKNELPPQTTQTETRPETDATPQAEASPQAEATSQAEGDLQTEAGPAPEAQTSSETDARNLEAAAETAVQVTTTRIEPTPVDCDPNTPGIQTEAPRSAQVEVPRTEARVEPARQGTLQRRSCPRPEIQTTRPLPEMMAYLAQNNIHIVKGTPEPKHIQRFIEDFERFPQSLRNEMASRGSRINLIVGQGVSEDPSWAAEAAQGQGNGWNATTDGRSWATTMGSGGFLGRPQTPTRIVVNRTYDTSFTNIFLHEYAHTLDRMHGEYSITRSRIWQQTLARDPSAQQMLQNLCADNYCANPAHPEESFAELFAYYHGCAESRAHMTQVMPNVARFFERMTNVRALLDGRIDMSPRTPANQ
jgi:hypothetical protein